MTLLAACDLDRTAIWSQRMLGPTAPDASSPLLTCVEVDRGRPAAFMTEAAYALVAALNAVGLLVPATTRTVEQYRRVRLPGPPPRFALCANGGRLLVDGVEDAAYSLRIAALVAGVAPVHEVATGLRALIDGRSGVRTSRVADDIFCCLRLDPEVDPGPLSAEIADWAADRGWVVSVQGRKIYALPAGLTKRAGMEYLVERNRGAGYIAAGDATLDADMLTNAVKGMIPRGSLLQIAGWSSERVCVTEQSGVHAGEEIMRWLHALATPTAPGSYHSASPNPKEKR